MAEERAEATPVQRKSLRRQVVGSLVLIAAIAVLFPIVFDGSGRKTVHKVTDIPPVIKKDTQPLEFVDTPEIEWFTDTESNDQAQLLDAPAGDSVSSDSLAAEKPAVTDTASQPSARATKKAEVLLGWAVQLGTFSNEANATKLVADLKARELGGWMRHIVRKDDVTLYQVFAGPWVHEEKARQIREQLDKEFKLKGLVIRFSEQ